MNLFPDRGKRLRLAATSIMKTDGMTSAGGMASDNEVMASIEPGGYLAFLGRLSPQKGAHISFSLAKRAALPLRLRSRFRACRAVTSRNRSPHVDDQLIRLIGEMDDRHKAEFLAMPQRCCCRSTLVWS
jgi:hypothetical protein